jgi:Amt family ammonium transporter
MTLWQSFTPMLFAVAGSLGGLLTGFFAEPKLCRLFYLVPNWEHYIGLAYGLKTGNYQAGFNQMGIQLLGIVFVVSLNIFTTSIICLFIRFCGIPLRLSEEELQIGDDAILGEEAYALWGDGEKERFMNSKHNSAYGDNFQSVVPKGEVQMA